MNDGHVTLVNVIDVDPARQPELVELVSEGIDEVIRHRPGFAGATVLASADGGRVVSLARWHQPADAAATRDDPDAAAYARRIAELARPQPALFRTVHEIL